MTRGVARTPATTAAKPAASGTGPEAIGWNFGPSDAEADGVGAAVDAVTGLGAADDATGSGVGLTRIGGATVGPAKVGSGDG